MEVSAQPTTRLMQVKVLYTFNDEKKSNCLARCQQPLQIQTAHLDSKTEIGIIELRICIQAIVSASPELVAQLGHDFTIYAYDYSEYETPLVGQGLLSWILGSASSTPNAPADQSKTMVTGRVCKNVLSVFSGGAKETLEVKLRLVRVPTCLQSEYLAGMEKYRSTSTVVGQTSFDTAAWSTFLQANPTFGATNPIPTSPAIVAPQPQHNSFNTANQPSVLTTDSSYFDPNFHTLELSGPSQSTAAATGSRPNTPSQSRPQAGKRKNPPSRPSSRASARGSRRNSKQINQPPDTSEAEDAPARKRARVTKADWNGSSAFGNNSDSLRVTAATAASIRGNRPSLNPFPSASDIAAAEPGIRPPTPRPQAIPRKTKPRVLARTVTNVAHDILTNPSSNQNSPYYPDQTASPETSPEKQDDSSTSTPFDIPSSPPIIAGPSPTPSSPQLPVLPFNDDSGFMSGNFDDEYFDDEAHPLDTEDLLVTGRYKSKAHEIHSDLPSSDFAAPLPRLHPRSFSEPQQPPFENNEVRPRWTSVNDKRSGLSNVSLSCDDGLPAEPQTEPARPQQGETKPRDNNASEYPPVVSDGQASTTYPNSGNMNESSRQRSESCAVENTSAAGSPAAFPETRPVKGRQNSVMHEKKKQSVQDHLANAIKTGQMPRFCKNCGEISTPTWRKAFVKIQQGIPDPVSLPDVENGLVTWEALEKDDKGTILSYRIIKKFTSKGETGFDPIDLCNSCGVWLFKHSCMRPPEAWNKPDGPKPPPKPRKRSSKKKDTGNQSVDTTQQASKHESSDGVEGEEGGCADSDAPCLSREVSAVTSEGEHFKKPRLERANSVTAADDSTRGSNMLDSKAAKAALTRAIQSSPPRFPGSQFSPIEIDQDHSSTPKPTRRLLFPSPRKPGEVKSLEDPTESNGKTRAIGKENQKPAEDSDDELDQLFNNEDMANSLRTPKSKSLPDDLLKTPGPVTRSASAKRRAMLSSASKRPRLSDPSTPSRAAKDVFAQDPAEMTPFTRQLKQLISEANNSDGADATFGNMDASFFEFPDFDPEDIVLGGDFDASNSGIAPFGMYEDPLTSSDALWNPEEMDRTIDAYLQDHDASNGGVSGNA